MVCPVKITIGPAATRVRRDLGLSDPAVGVAAKPWTQPTVGAAPLGVQGQALHTAVGPAAIGGAGGEAALIRM